MKLAVKEKSEILTKTVSESSDNMKESIVDEVIAAW